MYDTVSSRVRIAHSLRNYTAGVLAKSFRIQLVHFSMFAYVYMMTNNRTISFMKIVFSCSCIVSFTCLYVKESQFSHDPTAWHLIALLTNRNTDLQQKQVVFSKSIANWSSSFKRVGEKMLMLWKVD